jgi:hypothetical protein
MRPVEVLGVREAGVDGLAVAQLEALQHAGQAQLLQDGTSSPRIMSQEHDVVAT